MRSVNNYFVRRYLATRQHRFYILRDTGKNYPACLPDRLKAPPGKTHVYILDSGEPVGIGYIDGYVAQGDGDVVVMVVNLANGHLLELEPHQLQVVEEK